MGRSLSVIQGLFSESEHVTEYFGYNCEIGHLSLGNSGPILAHDHAINKHSSVYIFCLHDPLCLRMQKIRSNRWPIDNYNVTNKGKDFIEMLRGNFVHYNWK